MRQFVAENMIGQREHYLTILIMSRSDHVSSYTMYKSINHIQNIIIRPKYEVYTLDSSIIYLCHSISDNAVCL